MSTTQQPSADSPTVPTKSRFAAKLGHMDGVRRAEVLDTLVKVKLKDILHVKQWVEMYNDGYAVVGVNPDTNTVYLTERDVRFN